ncbi:hypothetical protein CCACVL1_28329 [Corchorus capsularis]|uniref:Uncharacterized protein n=1 Tax=Corchorus capsularis TaxID=210143 RepID=A0A1R3G6U8_COCAP|nr:hypothetical protein CCACVL1_28329 [Corchorus capsularis]
MSLIARLASILLLLIAVQAQEFFPSSSEETSLLSEFDFPHDFQDTNQFPHEIQSDAHQNSLFSESEFPEDSGNTEFPLESQEFPMETESHSEKRSPLPSPPPPKKAPPPPFRDGRKAAEYVNNCYKKCVKKF